MKHDAHSPRALMAFGSESTPICTGQELDPQVALAVLGPIVSDPVFLIEHAQGGIAAIERGSRGNNRVPSRRREQKEQLQIRPWIEPSTMKIASLSQIALSWQSRRHVPPLFQKIRITRREPAQAACSSSSRFISSLMRLSAL
jgi:hypothetical protein